MYNTQGSINRWMDKEDAVHMHNSAIKFESALVRWMSLQSEVSQKKKNKYSILMCIYLYRIQKNGIDEPICREGMETQT